MSQPYSPLSQSRMPYGKRKFENGKFSAAKKYKFAKRLAPKNQFVNQLGGWSNYPIRRSRPVLRYFTTNPTTVPLSAAVNANGQLTIQQNDVPSNILKTYQRIKIKKITVFLAYTYQSLGDGMPLQFAVARALGDTTSVNAQNIPGAQIKMITPSTSTSDILRAARFYPVNRIELGVAGQAATGDAYEPKWVSTHGNSGTTMWNAFVFNINGQIQNESSYTYYYTVELLCDGQKSDL